MISVRQIFTVGTCSIVAISACQAAPKRSAPPIPVAEVTRQLRVGDTWTYRISFGIPSTTYLYGLPLHSVHRGGAGRLTLKVVAVQTGNGPTRLAFLESEKYRNETEDVDRTVSVYFEQEADTGDVVSVAPDPDDPNDVRKGIIEPGHWSEGLTFQGSWLIRVPASEEQADPIRDPDILDTVADAEYVRTPAGRYAAWKVSRLSNADRDTMSDNGWYAPEIGVFVKRVRTISTRRADYPKLIETLELVSTNLQPNK